ncbi:MAG: helix-turn-helix domain-containing protein [Candidatus Sabulitectum sp.]|nr:helix-turn-helix domain-containing protein [Candidatus Sabulitectum sp.]
MTTIDPKFGQEIRRLREAKGISQRKLGEIVGLASGYVSRIERAEFKPPSEQKIVAMAEVLGANKDYLLSLSGKVSSDVKDAVTDNPETMSEAVRSFEDIGDWAGIALLFLALLVLFSSNENKEGEVKKKVGKLMVNLRKEAEKLDDEKQLEMIGHIKDFMDVWEKDVKQR